MALDRLVPVSGTPGIVSGNTYMDAVAEEITGLWDRSRIKVSAVSGTDTITCTITPPLTAGFVDGMSFVLRPVATNTGAVTLNGVAVKDGEGGTLTGGALRNGGAYDLVYVSALTALVIVGYFPATLTPGHKFLKTQVAAASSTIDFVNGVAGVVLDNTFDTYQIDISGVQPATDDAELWLRIGTGAGPTYQTANYKWTIQQRDTTGDLSRSSASDAKLIIAGGSGAGKAQGNATAENGRFSILLSNPEITTQTMLIDWRGGFLDTSTIQCAVNGAGSYQAGTAVTAIRFMYESGNIAIGRFTLIGLTKA
jgi:hypothetical protein